MRGGLRARSRSLGAALAAGLVLVHPQPASADDAAAPAVRPIDGAELRALIEGRRLQDVSERGHFVVLEGAGRGHGERNGTRFRFEYTFNERGFCRAVITATARLEACQTAVRIGDLVRFHFESGAASSTYRIE